MQVLRCVCCGALLPLPKDDSSIIVCEYCDSENILQANFHLTAKKPIKEENPLLLSLPFWRPGFFKKSILNIYKNSVEAIDKKTGSIYLHIDYTQVKKFRAALLDNQLIFTMKSGKKIRISGFSSERKAAAKQLLKKQITPQA